MRSQETSTGGVSNRGKDTPIRLTKVILIHHGGSAIPYLLGGRLNSGLVVEGRHGLGPLPLRGGGGGAVLDTVGRQKRSRALECGGASLALGPEAKAHHGHRGTHCAGLPRVNKSVSAVRGDPKHATGLGAATMACLTLSFLFSLFSSPVSPHRPFHISPKSCVGIVTRVSPRFSQKHEHSTGYGHQGLGQHSNSIDYLLGTDARHQLARAHTNTDQLTATLLVGKRSTQLLLAD